MPGLLEVQEFFIKLLKQANITKLLFLFKDSDISFQS